MKELEAITTVYSYRFPHIRVLISDLTDPFPHEVFLSATNPPGNLDDFHEPIIDKILEFYSEFTPALADFSFRYPTSGSEEGIKEILTNLQSKGVKNIYVLDGEYEGFKAVAESRCIETIEVSSDIDPNSLEPGYFFISNPSARDGNIISNDYVNNICEAGHKVFYDLAYLGSTRQHEFDLSHENIFAAVISFSKPYGLFYDRIGFTFSRESVPSLYGNKWFKSVFGLMIAEKIVTETDPLCLYRQYRPVQEEIVAEINEDLGLKLRLSDALLLAYMTKEDVLGLDSEQRESISRFKRGDSYRFCLTPYFLNKD